MSIYAPYTIQLTPSCSFHILLRKAVAMWMYGRGSKLPNTKCISKLLNFFLGSTQCFSDNQHKGYTCAYKRLLTLVIC